MATAMGVGSSHGSSSESEISAPETFRESSTSPLRSPDTTTEDVIGVPYLQLVEPPVESYRFRYPTEMKGTHGSILGISTLRKENARKKIFPSVKLNNYHPSTPDSKVIIRCSLTTADEDEKARIPHVHQLKGKGRTSTSQGKTVEVDDPIDIVVSSSNYQATFGNMTILYIKKEVQLKELVKKKKRHFQNLYPFQKLMFTDIDEKELLESAKKEISEMNLNRLNTACLKFEALEANHGQSQYKPICHAIYTNPIKNIKSAQFNDLRICRIDKVAGSCLGKDEVFIFVEKVNKKDIKIRFFELNDCDEEIWEAYADLGEEDVHYQFAIAFRTPKYKNVEITGNVQVYFQLERPSSGSRSAPKEFEYTPDPNRWRDEIRKRPRRESPPIPATVQDLSRPSTSSSAASPWNPVRPSFMNVFNPPGQWSSSSSAVTGGSDSSSAVAMEDSFSEIAEILKGFEDQDFYRNIEMDVQQEGNSSILSSRPSLNEFLSSFSSGDSDAILQMIKTPEAMNQWASCNGVPDLAIQQIMSEVTSSGDAQGLRSEDKFVTDGASEPQIVYAEHQSAKPEMQQGWTIGNASSKTHPGLGKHIISYNRNRSRLTRENIVSNVDKVLKGLLNLKKIGKLQDKDMKCCILGTFATCVGGNDDRVLHVLASDPNFPPLMLKFLNVLKMYDIAEPVVNLKNSRGQNTLHLAAEKGSLQTISLLVDSGADVNARDNSLNTPVHLVANREHNDAFHAVSHILEKNPDLTIYNEDGLTALHLFVIKRKSDIISSLIVKSEDNLQVDVINQPDRKQGNTALHMAVQKKFLEIVNLLLNFEDRIEVNVKNFEDKTPLAYVSGKTVEDLKIEELLIANKADPSLVLAKTDKISKELNEFKDEIDNDSDHEDGVEDVDESLSSYAQDWKSDAELKLMDSNTICSVCPVLDENQNWAKLLKILDFDEDIFHFLELKWSPTLYLLKTVAETMPNITPEKLRDKLIKINPECKKAAQFIDDMILCSMGVF